MTTGHETLMAKVTFFSVHHESTEQLKDKFVFSQEFTYQDTLLETTPPSQARDIPQASAAVVSDDYYALVEFEKPILCPPKSKVIGSRLDKDTFSNKCRIAFHGNFVEIFTQRDYESSVLPRIRIFKPKRRDGLVDRVCAMCGRFKCSVFKKVYSLDSR